MLHVYAMHALQIYSMDIVRTSEWPCALHLTVYVHNTQLCYVWSASLRNGITSRWQMYTTHTHTHKHIYIYIYVYMYKYIHILYHNTHTNTHERKHTHTSATHTQTRYTHARMAYAKYDSFIYDIWVTWLIHTCDMTHSRVWHNTRTPFYPTNSTLRTYHSMFMTWNTHSAYIRKTEIRACIVTYMRVSLVTQNILSYMWMSHAIIYYVYIQYVSILQTYHRTTRNTHSTCVTRNTWDWYVCSKDM